MLSVPFYKGDILRCVNRDHVMFNKVGVVVDCQPTNITFDIMFNNNPLDTFRIEKFYSNCFIKEPQEEIQESSQVESPKHYQVLPGIQVRDIANTIADRLAEAGYAGGFISDYVQMLQYLLRFDQKGNDLQDLEKAKKYLDWMITNLELRDSEKKS